MGELELVGLHEDGEHLVLVAPDGARFRVRIDEPLRAAVRRDRPQLEQLRAESAGTLSPREIQARIRAGATTQEVADSAGLPVERVRRYEGPVLAEREHVAEQARGTRVGRDVGAPTLGDLVTDRLAARGVDLASLAWDAARDASGPWVVLARFAVGDAEREARWTFDLAKRTVVADEDEARWLSETELPDEPVSRRHLAAVRDVVFDFQGDGRPCATPAGRRRRRARARARARPAGARPRRCWTTCAADAACGRRVELDDDDSEEFEGFGPQHAFDFGRPDASVPGAHPRRRRRRGRGAGLPGARLPSPEPVTTPRPRPSTTSTPSARGRRAAGAPRCPAGTRSSSARSPSEARTRQMLSSSAEASVCGARRGRPGGRGGHAAHVVPTAQDLVADLVGTGLDVADDHLRALDHHGPADGAGVVGRPRAAPAQRPDLQDLDPVGQLDQPGGTGEQPGAEVRRDAEHEDVDPELVDDPRQLLHLRRRCRTAPRHRSGSRRVDRACGAR